MSNPAVRTAGHQFIMPIAIIESLDHDGRGVTHVNGKVVFIEGALLGEEVEYSSYRRKPSYEQATATRILRASAQRVTPHCGFSACVVVAACSISILSPRRPSSSGCWKMPYGIWHGYAPNRFIPPSTGHSWGYRYRARLSVRLVPKKGGVLVGFHERRSSYVADMDSCAVLPPLVSALLPALRALVAGLSIPDRLPQIEVAVSDFAGRPQCALVLRILESLTAADEAALRSFAETHGVVFYLQPAGPGSVRLFILKRYRGCAMPCRNSVSCTTSSQPISPGSTTASTAFWCAAPWHC